MTPLPGNLPSLLNRKHPAVITWEWTQRKFSKTWEWYSKCPHMYSQAKANLPTKPVRLRNRGLVPQNLEHGEKRWPQRGTGPKKQVQEIRLGPTPCKKQEELGPLAIVMQTRCKNSPNSECSLEQWLRESSKMFLPHVQEIKIRLKLSEEPLWHCHMVGAKLLFGLSKHLKLFFKWFRFSKTQNVFFFSSEYLSPLHFKP